jgi:hypothetical protein
MFFNNDVNDAYRNCRQTRFRRINPA